MSQENVEIVRRTNEALQGVDVAPAIRAAFEGNTDAVAPEVAAAFVAWLNLFDPEVEIDTSGVNMAGSGVFRGLDGLLDIFGRWIEEWEHYSWIYHKLSDAGEHVILDAEIQRPARAAESKSSGISARRIRFSDGKVIPGAFSPIIRKHLKP